MDEQKIDGQTPKQELISLKDFIDEKQKLISVIGVFVTLGLFWRTLFHTDSTPYISYLCFLITIPLFLEVRKGYQPKDSSWNLKIFVDLFTSVLFFTAVNLLTEYPNHLETIMGGVVWSLTGFGLLTLTEKIANELRAGRYKKVLAIEKQLIADNVEIDKRNKRIILENAKTARFGTKVTIFEIIGMIYTLIIPFVVTHYFSEYVHPTAEVIIDKQIDAEQVPSIINSNINVEPKINN